MIRNQKNLRIHLKVIVDGEKNGDPEDWCGVDIVNSLNINDTPDFQTAII